MNPSPEPGFNYSQHNFFYFILILWHFPDFPSSMPFAIRNLSQFLQPDLFPSWDGLVI